MGELVDNLGPISTGTTSPTHRSAHAFIQLDTQLAIFETGIKVVLAEPEEKLDYFGELIRFNPHELKPHSCGNQVSSKIRSIIKR